MTRSITRIIKDYLKQKGIKQVALAKMLGEHSSNLNAKLKGRDMPTGYVARISDALQHNFFDDLSNEYCQEGRAQAQNSPPPVDNLSAMADLMKAIVEQNNMLIKSKEPKPSNQ